MCRRSEATGTGGEVKKIKVTQRKEEKEESRGRRQSVCNSFVVCIEINLESGNRLGTSSAS